MDPELFPGSRSGIIVPDPAQNEREELKFYFSFMPVDSGLCGQIDNRQIDNLQIDNLQIDNRQIDNRQIDNKQKTFIS